MTELDKKIQRIQERDSITHHGVKGMKWGIRKAKEALRENRLRTLQNTKSGYAALTKSQRRKMTAGTILGYGGSMAIGKAAGYGVSKAAGASDNMANVIGSLSGTASGIYGGYKIGKKLNNLMVDNPYRKATSNKKYKKNVSQLQKRLKDLKSIQGGTPKQSKRVQESISLTKMNLKQIQDAQKKRK